MTLKLSIFSEVIGIHVYAKFRQSKRSGPWVIVVTEKNVATMLKIALTLLPLAVI